MGQLFSLMVTMNNWMPLAVGLVLVHGVLGNFLVQLSNNTNLFKFLGQHPHINEKVTSTYSFGNFQGFSGSFDSSHIRYLRNSLYVNAVSPDIKVRADEVQFGAPRHLSRISRRKRLPSGKFFDECCIMSSFEVFFLGKNPQNC